MADYDIEIEWISAWADGCWSWTLNHNGVHIHADTSQWRWSGLWAAKRYARRHAKGKIKPPDDGSRKIKYTVGG